MIDIKLFVRNLMRNKLYFAITVLGFAIALTFVLVLSVYIRQELSVDRFHKNKDRIYRMVDEEGSYWGSLIGHELQSKYPEIECFTRFYSRHLMIETPRKEKVFLECLLADSSFFRMFSFPLIKGDPATVFRNKNSIVLTRSYARKMFGSEDILGQEILIEEKFKRIVTGIMEDIPYNTHIRPVDGIVPFEFIGELWMPAILENNANSSFGLYLMTYPGTDITSKKELMLAEFKKSYWKYHSGHQSELSFEPLTSIYWGGKNNDATRGNSRTTIVVLSTIALLVLILALINYTNLSIAQTTNRAKEAAIKKLLGIGNFSLLRQFISESIVICLFSFMIALLFSWVLQPFFERILDSRLYYAGLWSWKNGIVLIMSVLILGSIAGFIPAWMITRFKPVEVVKGVFRKKVKSVYGNALICFQYVVAIALMVSTFTIVSQVHYMRNYKLGFDRENVIWLDNRIQPSEKEALRNELMRIPGVLNLSFCAGSPLDGGNNYSFEANGKPASWQIFKIDTAFFHVLDIHVEPTGIDRGVWVNRTLVREYELGDKPLNLGSINQVWNSVTIVGITDDFHFRDLKQKIGPAYIIPLGKNEYPWSILVKIDKQHPVQTYEEIKKVYKHFIGEQAFDSGFMDQSIDRWYTEEDRMVGLIGYFTVIACALAIMGILGMSAYFIQQRLKEIGLRRINGAKVTDVLYMLILGFVKWVILAFIIAVPIAWYFMNDWLATYPYHISQQVWIYLGVGIVACIIAVLTVGGQSYQAASLNPVKTLRNE